jgi:hypothetical protein
LADFKRGIKAGVVTAGIYIVISVILAAIGHRFLYLSDFIFAAGLEIPLGLTDPSFVITLILVYIVPYVVRGIVFGAVFAALYDYLPSVNSIVKGVVLSSFLWIVAVIEVIYTTPGWPWHDGGHSYAATYYGSTVCLSSVGLALAGIISALAFGALVGFIWNRLRAKELREARKGNAALLLGFALGIWMWVSGVVVFFMNVVVRGFPVIDEPGPAWWYSVLYASVVFLGLPGWVLARAAWKKTKVDKSGFKWGVAGGVMMALTGIMLLPGALAITGGVLSRRKPVTESSTAEIEQ